MRKKIYIVLGGILLILFMLALVALMLPKEQNPPINIVTPTSTPTPAPEILRYPADSFHILNAMPSQNAIQPYLPSQKITLVFNLPITPELLKYELSPLASVKIMQGPNPTTLFIIPETFWTIGETTITILQTTRSTNNKPLFSPYTHKLKTDYPPVPEGIFEGE